MFYRPEYQLANDYEPDPGRDKFLFTSLLLGENMFQALSNPPPDELDESLQQYFIDDIEQFTASRSRNLQAALRNRYLDRATRIIDQYRSVSSNPDKLAVAFLVRMNLLVDEEMGINHISDNETGTKK